MKKKGFTLIELLAVIVIISVIALIATPIIYNLISNSKEQAFRNKIYAIEEAANTYYEDLILGGNEEEFSKGLDGIYSLTLDLSKKEDIEKLDIKGKTIKKGIVTITEEGKVSITAVEEKLCGQKISTSKVINMLNIKEDFMCYLLDSSSGDIGTQDILTAINNLKESNENLTKKVEDLTVSNQELKDTIKDINNKGIGTESALNKIYPVGSIYISTTLNTKEKVKEAIGGDWESYGDGKVLRGTTGTSEETGGASNVSLTTANLPSHSHSIPVLSGTANSTGNGYGIGYTYSNRNTGTVSNDHTHSIPALTGSTTSTGVHNHIIAGRSNGFGGEVMNGVAATSAAWDSTEGQMTRTSGGHSHNIQTNASTTGGISADHYHGYRDYYANKITGVEAHTHSVTTTASNTGNTGTNTSFSVLDPYITVYMYKRVR